MEWDRWRSFSLRRRRWRWCDLSPGDGIWNGLDGPGEAIRVRLDRGVPSIMDMGAAAEADDDVLSMLVSKDLSKPYAVT